MKFMRFVVYILILSLFLTGCSPLLSDKKPSKSYYTNFLSMALERDNIKSITAYETNLSKTITVDKNLYYIIKDLFSSLKESNFIDKPSDISSSPIYRYYVTFTNNDEYVIDVYDKDIISVYPWDGNYKRDYINTASVPKAYNLTGLSKYLFPKI